VLTILYCNIAIERLGNKGWNFDLLKKYHLKSERFVEPKVKHEAMSYDLEQHGTDGEVYKPFYHYHSLISSV